MRCLVAVVAGLVLSVLAGRAAAGEGPQDGWPWSPAVRGVQSRLRFAKHTFKQGEPIVVHIEIRNVGDKPVPYDRRRGAAVRKVGPDGNEPPDITRSWQIAGDFDRSKQPPLYVYPTLRPGQIIQLGRHRFDLNHYPDHF